ncbi:MAG TPA: phosphopyruvate hydratase [Patescibacteria group bacterium]|nr:phosphopyruvate hydratase [Patescibacteria group bacterium]
MKLKQLFSREVLDSRGNPTVAVRAVLEDGSQAEAMVPSGASTGSHEALELRDNDKKRYLGKGVLKACANVTELIMPVVKNVDVFDQRAVDQIMIELDGTENKSNLGANAILGVSLAIAQAAARSQKMELYQYIRKAYALPFQEFRMPYEMMNIINGGKHADSGLDMQECMIIPQQSALRERIRVGAEIFHTLKKVLAEHGHGVGVGDEGGFAPKMQRNEQALELIAEAIQKAGYALGKDVCLGLDVAASEFYAEHVYTFDKKQLNAEELLNVYDQWKTQYAFILIEDGLAEDDWENWQKMTERFGKELTLIGDDLFVTNQKRLQQGIDCSVANAILIKLNQIGTLTETIDTIVLAQKNQYKVIISHRSGETEDTTIADLAVAVNADFIKTGSLSRSERIAKYNRLMAIDLLNAGAL